MNEIERKANRELSTHRVEFGPSIAGALMKMTPPAKLPKMFVAKKALLTKAPRRK